MTLLFFFFFFFFFFFVKNDFFVVNKPDHTKPKVVCSFAEAVSQDLPCQTQPSKPLEKVKRFVINLKQFEKRIKVGLQRKLLIEITLGQG
jgi:hypothetical protein